jgi:hypothetical protein
VTPSADDIEQGRLAEHWDVLHTKPARLPHDNGLF